MNKLNHYSQSGHCFPELVEKKDGKVIAQMKSNLWKDDYIRINNNFQKIVKEPLKDGIKILLCAKIIYDPVYGLSLRIMDIDTSYSLGDLEREKTETIKKIREEGIYNKNKEHKLALLPKRIAIISVQSSKGYSDFMKVIEGNTWGYNFFHFLFPSLLQGDKAVISMINQLKRIKKVKNHFDVVAIIRGGGGDIGLSCYNNFSLAKEIALFPIPVITGIGHSTNETVVEMLAYENAITPSKLAEFLLQKFHNFSVPVQKAEEKLIDKSRRILKDEQLKFQNSVKQFRSISINMITSRCNEVKNQSKTLLLQTSFFLRYERESYISFMIGIKKGVKSFIQSKNQQIKHVALSINKDVVSNLRNARLYLNQSRQQVTKNSKVSLLSNRENIGLLKDKIFKITTFFFKNLNDKMVNIERSVNNMSPKNVLKRGYSITMLNGKVLKSHKQAKQGDMVDTLIVDGNILSQVKTITKSDDYE